MNVRERPGSSVQFISKIKNREINTGKTTEEEKIWYMNIEYKKKKGV